MSGPASPANPLLARLRTEGCISQQSILEELRRVLVSGAARPGVALPVDELAAAFQVSRIPIREALKTLNGEGLVDHQPRGGYTVAQLTLPEFRELYVARAALESAALPTAARSATAEDHARAQATLSREAQALHEGDLPTYHRGSRAFHLVLVGPARMPRLLHLVESTWNITEPAQTMTLLPPEELAVMHEEHTAMFDAWRARDVELLLERAGAHADRLLASLELLPSDG